MPKQPQKNWDGKSRGGRFGHLFFVYTLKMLGVRAAYVFLAFIVPYFVLFAPKATRAVWKYNRRIWKYGFFSSIAKLFRHYYTFGQTLIDKIAIKSGMAGRYHFEFDNYERFLQIIDDGRGAVMIGAHVGCWEAGSVFFGKYGRKINVVMFDSERREIKEVIERGSSGRNFKLIPVNTDTVSAMIRIKVALNNGEYVCFNGDRYLDRSNSLSAKLRGFDAAFPAGPFRIPVRCGVPVVFHYAMRERGRTYRFIFREAELNTETTDRELLGQYAESLDRILESYPQQWFNFYDFWNETGHETDRTP